MILNDNLRWRQNLDQTDYKNVLSVSKVFRPTISHKRTFWEYVNMMFNKPDSDRIKQLGPDRACAEWVLRNGGKIVWADGKKLSDYNSLPAEAQGVPKIIEIDGSDSSISHYGFSHLRGCSMLQKIILHNNNYIDDRAMKGLFHAKDTLTYLQISKCVNVTDNGLRDIQLLQKLRTLVLFNLHSVKNVGECKLYLQTCLPNCKIEEAGEQANEKLQ